MYEIWMSPAEHVDYYYAGNRQTRSEAEAVAVEWAEAGYLVVVRDRKVVN